MKGVAIIPARAGSKRIPKKNIKLFFVNLKDLLKSLNNFVFVALLSLDFVVNKLFKNFIKVKLFLKN